jgi:hypothetical protein
MGDMASLQYFYFNFVSNADKEADALDPLGHEFTGVFPNLDSAVQLQEFYMTQRPDYKYQLTGIFPNISAMANFEYCVVTPSSLCRRAEIPLEVYASVIYGCDAGQLPVCTEEQLVTIAAAQERAADPVLSVLDEAELYASYAKDAADEQAVIDAEIARVNALDEAERAADEAAQARIYAAKVEEEKAAALLLLADQSSAALPAFTPAIFATIVLVLAAL